MSAVRRLRSFFGPLTLVVPPSTIVVRWRREIHLLRSESQPRELVVEFFVLRVRNEVVEDFFAKRRPLDVVNAPDRCTENCVHCAQTRAILAQFAFPRSKSLGRERMRESLTWSMIRTAQFGARVPPDV